MARDPIRAPLYPAKRKAPLRVTGADWGAGGSGSFSPLALSPEAWYDPTDLSTLFQDAAMTTPVTADNDPVGAMLDKSGNGLHLTQGTAGARPLYQTTADKHWLEGDGSDDHLLDTFALSQPITRVSAWRVLTNANKALCGGMAGVPFQLFWYNDATLFVSMSAGTEVFFVRPPPALGDDFVSVEIYNGASSSLQVNDGSPSTQDAGATATDGLTLLATQGGPSPINARCYGLTILPRVASAAEIAQLVNYYADLCETSPI